MKIFNLNIIGRLTSNTLGHLSLLFGIIVFILSSCSANGGIKLRNKSIKEWEKKERKLEMENSKDTTTYSRKLKGNDQAK